MSYDDLVFTWPCGEPPDVNELHALMAVVRLSGGDGVCTVSADILAALRTACTHASHGVVARTGYGDISRLGSVAPSVAVSALRGQHSAVAFAEQRVACNRNHGQRVDCHGC